MSNNITNNGTNNGTNSGTNNTVQYFIAIGMLIGIGVFVYFIFKNMNKSSGSPVSPVSPASPASPASPGGSYDTDTIQKIVEKVIADKGISINNGVITAKAILVTTVDTEWILIDRSNDLKNGQEVIAIKAPPNNVQPVVTTYYDNKPDGTSGYSIGSFIGGPPPTTPPTKS